MVDQASTTKVKKISFKACRHCGKNNNDVKDCFCIKPYGICGKNSHSKNNCFSKKNSANIVEDTSDEKAYMVDDKDFCFEGSLPESSFQK